MAYNVSSALFGLRSDRALLVYALLAFARTAHLLWRTSMAHRTSPQTEDRA